MKYIVIYEKGKSSWGAYVPDLPGCGVSADTKEEVQLLIKEAIQFHIEGLKEAGEEIPESSHFVETINI